MGAAGTAAPGTHPPTSARLWRPLAFLHLAEETYVLSV